MNKKLVAIRGATCCDNTESQIMDYVCKMCNEIFIKNNLTKQDIVSIQFTVTKDINALNPAKALRTGNSKIDVSEVPLFCAQEPDFKGSLEYVIRVMITAYMNEFSNKYNVYINGAERLRPDFYIN